MVAIEFDVSEFRCMMIDSLPREICKALPPSPCTEPTVNNSSCTARPSRRRLFACSGRDPVNIPLDFFSFGVFTTQVLCVRIPGHHAFKLAPQRLHRSKLIADLRGHRQHGYW